MYGLIFQLTSKTNFFYLWSSLGMKFSPKVKKTNFHKKIWIFRWKNIFWPFFKCASLLYNLPWLLQSNTCSRRSIYQRFFQNLPRGVKNVKKRFKRNKIKQIHNLNARVPKLNPKVGIPLGMNGIQFQHSSIQIVDLFDFVAYMPPSNSNFRGDCQVQ